MLVESWNTAIPTRTMLKSRLSDWLGLKQLPTSKLQSLVRNILQCPSFLHAALKPEYALHKGWRFTEELPQIQEKVMKSGVNGPWAPENLWLLLSQSLHFNEIGSPFLASGVCTGVEYNSTMKVFSTHWTAWNQISMNWDGPFSVANRQDRSNWILFSTGPGDMILSLLLCLFRNSISQHPCKTWGLCRVYTLNIQQSQCDWPDPWRPNQDWFRNAALSGIATRQHARKGKQRNWGNHCSKGLRASVQSLQPAVLRPERGQHSQHMLLDQVVFQQTVPLQSLGCAVRKCCERSMWSAQIYSNDLNTSFAPDEVALIALYAYLSSSLIGPSFLSPDKDI